MSRFTLLKLIYCLLMFPQLLSGAEVPFHLVNNLIIVQAEIDHKRGNFILDTGADNLILHEKEVSDSEISVLYSLDGVSAGSHKNIHRFAFGNNTFRNLAAVTTDLSPVSQYVEIQIDGIIGAGMLKKSRILIDFKHREIKFLSTPEKKRELQLKHAIPFKMIDGVPVARVKIGRNKFNFILDSGATIHLIDSKIVNAMSESFSALESGIKLQTVAGQPSDIYKLYISRAISIGKTTLENLSCAAADFSDIRSASGTSFDGVISISRLAGNNQLIIDFDKGALYF